MHKLYSVSIYWGTMPAFPVLVDGCLTRVTTDWIRFSEGQWYVWSVLPPRPIAEEIRAITGRDPQIVITRIMSKAADGHAPQWIWDWMNDKMQRQLRDE